MNTAKLMAGIAGVLATMAVAIAVVQIHESGTAAAELKSAREKRDVLAAQVSETENKIQQAKRLAAEAEKDSGELLKPLEAVRAQQMALVRSAITAPGLSGQVGKEGRRSSPGGASGAPASEEEQQRLVQERAFQRDVAKKRADVARRRAGIEYPLRQLDPAERFNRWIEEAGQLAANAEFQTGIRVFNQAMAEKPADLPVPESVKQLQATLQAQNSPVDVAFISDGLTFVSVVDQKFLGRIETGAAKILPGDYEVVGRRPGYQDVVIKLSVRAGMAPPAVSVACTQPVKP